VPDFLDEKRDEIDDRLAELRPLIEEYNRLQAASAALAEVAGSSAARAAVGTASPVLSTAEEVPSAMDEAPRAAAAQEDVSALSPAPIRRGPGRPRGSDSGTGSDGDAADGAGTAAGIHSEDMPSPLAPRPQPPGLRPPGPRPALGPRRAGRPKGSGQRAAEALRIVREQPGVTIPELADRMGIKQNYLYRVLPELVQDGKVEKQGRGWHPRAA
jgi:hypothetical protein